MTERPINDFTCSEHSDCDVKNIGNCCGFYPKCVRADFCPDLEGVDKWCKTNMMMSVCSFSEIHACVCEAGTCEAVNCGKDGNCAISSAFGVGEPKKFQASDLVPTWPEELVVLSGEKKVNKCSVDDAAKDNAIDAGVLDVNGATNGNVTTHVNGTTNGDNAINRDVKINGDGSMSTNNTATDGNITDGDKIGAMKDRSKAMQPNSVPSTFLVLASVLLLRFRHA